MQYFLFLDLSHDVDIILPTFFGRTLVAKGQKKKSTEVWSNYVKVRCYNSLESTETLYFYPTTEFRLVIFDEQRSYSEILKVTLSIPIPNAGLTDMSTKF
jgi:hypothetical protein